MGHRVVSSEDFQIRFHRRDDGIEGRSDLFVPSRCSRWRRAHSKPGGGHGLAVRQVVAFKPTAPLVPTELARRLATSGGTRRGRAGLGRRTRIGPGVTCRRRGGMRDVLTVAPGLSTPPAQGDAGHCMQPTIRITRTFGFKDQEGAPKTRRGRRVVDLSPYLVEYLKRHRLDLAQAKLAAGWPDMPVYLFPGTDGRRLERRGFERAFARVLVKAGLPAHYSPKSLRHSYASILLSTSTKPNILLYVSLQLGHSSTAITQKHYTRWIRQPEPAANDLDGLLGLGLVGLGSKTVASGVQVAGR